MSWVKWAAATIITTVTLTVSSLTYLSSSYASLEKVNDLEKTIDKMDENIYRELVTIREDIKKILGDHGSKDRTKR